MAEVTKRTLFEAIASFGTETPVEITEEMVEYAGNALAKMDEQNAKAKVKAAEKRAAAGPSNVEAVNAKICEDAKAVLTGAMTRDELFAAMGGADYVFTKADGSDAPLTVQKLSTALAVAVNAGEIVKGKKLNGDKVATTYTLA